MIYPLYFFVIFLFFLLLLRAYSLWIEIARKYFYKKLSLRLKDTFIDDQLILDIGSGTGFFAEMMRSKISGQIFCLDLQRTNKSNAPFVIADARHLPFFDCSFDSTTLFYVLHHSDCPGTLLSEVCRVSRNRIIVHEDVYTNFFERIMYKVHIWSFNQLYQLCGKNAMTDNDWLKLFTEAKMKVIQKFRIKRLGYPVSRLEYILISHNKTR